MRVLISGGTGLIGSALVKSLGESGDEVTVLTRSLDRNRGGAANGVQMQQWDGATAEGWGALVSQVDAVVNLAGEGIADGRWTAMRKQRIRESRINAGKALVAAIDAAERKPSVLIQASAVGYYGPGSDGVLTEKSTVGSDYLAQVCFDWEASTSAVEAMGVRRPVIRTGVVLSEKGGAFSKIALPFRFFAGGPLGSGKQYFPWIHIADEIGAIRFLLEKENATGPYNLTAPNPPQNREFVRELGRVMGRPAFMPTPSFALKTVFGEMSTVLLDGQRAIPARLQEEGYRFEYPEAGAALRAIL